MSKNQKDIRSELLMPAGSLNKMKTALMYGADAVYAGVPNLSLRAASKMSFDEVNEGIKMMHDAGKRIYLALNMFTHNMDIPNLSNHIDTLRKLSPDGVIIADPGIFKMIREEIPELPLHVSTQANACSSLTVDFWKDQGAKLCVLGREVSFKELQEIKKAVPGIRLESFIHGAMCMSYSGRCLLSNFLAERAANQGKCAQCCRWNYKLHMRPKDDILAKGKGGLEEFAKEHSIEITPEIRELFDFFLEEEMRPDDFMQINEDERGSYIMNSRDMCLMPKLNQILDLGIDSLKVEGRNKSEYYVGIVARAYRNAIDNYNSLKENGNQDKWDYKPYMRELHTLQNRGYTFGFHDGKLTHHGHNYDTTRSTGAFRTAGFVSELGADYITLELRNNLNVGDEIELLSPSKFESFKIKLTKLIDARNDSEVEKLAAGHEKAIKIPLTFFKEQGLLENVNDAKELFPILSLARKQLNLSNEELEAMKKHSSSEPEMKLEI